MSTVQQFLVQALAFDPDFKKARLLLKRVKLLESIKKQGNEYFQQGKWNDALESYASFLEQADQLSILTAKVYSNRATIYSKLSEYAKSIQDVTTSLDLIDQLSFPNNNPNSISYQDRQTNPNSSLYYKLYLRRADGYLKTEKYEEAVRDYELASKLKPEDRSVKEALRNAKKQLEMSKRKDYYKILGCQRSASEVEIKKAYRKMALLYHPDKQQGLCDEEKSIAEGKFKEVTEAYEVLSDPRKKQMFDSGMNVDGSSASGGRGGYHQDMSDIFSMFGGGGGFGHAHGGFSYEEEEDDYSHYFHQQRRGYGSRGGFHSSPFGHH